MGANAVGPYYPNNVHNRVNTGADKINVQPKAAILNGVYLVNESATAQWFKLYDQAAAPVVATDVPIVKWQVPANQSVTVPLPNGITLANGLSYVVSPLQADTDATTVAAGASKVHLDYVLT